MTSTSTRRADACSGFRDAGASTRAAEIPPAMNQSIRKSTLEGLCERIARGPTPAGVSVAAISASLALGLLSMTLEVTGKRNDAASGRRRKVARLLSAARVASATMMDIADEDAAAFDAYLESRRLPHRTEREIARRERALASSLRRATEVPLRVARTAVRSLGLCADAAEVVHRAVAADLEAAAITLGASARIALRSARSNIARVAPKTAYYAKAASQAGELEREAFDLLDRTLTRTSQRQLA